MKSDLPKISVITVSLRSVETIEATIKSVLNQTYKHLEYLVIDGGSKDGTVELLEKYSSDGKFRFISEEDNGIYDAMNKGIKMARAEWIYFVGSDDTLFSIDTIESVFSQDFGNAEVIYGNVQLLHAGQIYDGPFDHEKISKNNICHQAMFIKKTLYEKLEGFNTNYPVAADYEFNIKWMGMDVPSVYINETIAVYNEKGFSYHVRDENFQNNRDTMLIENNIVCKRSFDYLKQKAFRLANSRRYKLGDKIISPIAKALAMVKEIVLTKPI
ncbi:MAG: glycosyltransferase [Ferruginibacter sp.]|nr:glycosyltransferase [Ferruginibacter sp.]